MRTMRARECGRVNSERARVSDMYGTRSSLSSQKLPPIRNTGSSQESSIFRIFPAKANVV
jgi:hypothetical protein